MKISPTTTCITSLITADTTLAAIALRSDAHASVLDCHKLDFCCRGARTLAEACAAGRLETAAVLAELDAVTVVRAPAVDGNDLSTPALIDLIVERHHAYTRTAIARITPLMAKVLARHGTHHPELAGISAAYTALAAELVPHMMREERMLFPYIRALASPQGAPPPPFGTVRNPVRVMMTEHDHAAALLAEISEATGDFVPPADACASYAALYAALAELRLDLLRHVSLENNVLFPRALALEARRGVALGSPSAT